MSIRKDGTRVLFNCFRAGCGYKGGLQINSLDVPFTIDTNSNRANSYSTIETIPIGYRDIYYIYNKYSIDYRTIVTNGIKLCANRNRLYIPCYDYYRNLFGYELKHKSWMGELHGPKSVFRFTEEPVPKVHFPVQEKNNTGAICLVEDVFSAIRLSAYAPTAALLGTHLSHSGVLHLLDLGVSRLYFILDEDATDKAMRLYSKFCLTFDELRVIPSWERDIKDMSVSELDRFVRENGIA